ncbi:MAG: restriction endonuclease [Gammaproteobacteria bacterium]
MTKESTEITGNEAGLSGDDQIKIAIKFIANNGGEAQMKELYPALEEHLQGQKLSKQGKASFRFFVNNVAVKAGLVYPHDKNSPGWRLTPAGKEYAESGTYIETTVNVDTNQEEIVTSNSARGLAFEIYIKGLLTEIYPDFVWHHQGNYKSDERGLDFIGDRLGESNSKVKSIGVQVKFHKDTNSPTQTEWLKFLSGCFARRVDDALFITTGRLSTSQYREAREADVTVIQGKDEICRIAEKYKLNRFELFDD